VVDAELVALDEPTSQLDRATARLVADAIRDTRTRRMRRVRQSRRGIDCRCRPNRRPRARPARRGCLPLANIGC
jgi:hypothetical protein